MAVPASQLCQSRCRAVNRVSARNNRIGLIRRTSRSGTSAKSNDTSRPTTTPWIAADGVIHARAMPIGARTDAGIDATKQAAGGREPQHQQHVGSEHLPGRRAEALEDRNAPHLLLHHDAGHTPNADAAEDHDREADQAEIVLRHREIAAEPILERPPRPDDDDVALKRAPQPSRAMRSGGAFPAMRSYAFFPTGRLPRVSSPKS